MNKMRLAFTSRVGVYQRVSSQRVVSAVVASVFLVFLLIAATAKASPDYFGEAAFGIDISRVTIDSDTDPELNPGGLRLRTSYQISKYFDVAGHLGFSFTESAGSFDNIGLGYFSGFLKGYLPLVGDSAVYGLLGVTAAGLSQDIRGRSFREDRGDFSWGFGAEVRVRNQIYLNADFVSYIQSDGLFEDISAVSIGLTFVY